MPDVQPVYPTFQRPSFDLAPVLAKANAISLQGRALRAEDQAYAQNEKMNPLELIRIQQQNEAGARGNDIGAATQDDVIAATKAELKYKITSALNGMDYSSADAASRKAQAIGAVTADVLAHPEHAAAAEKVMIDQGLMTPDAIPEWRQHLSDPKTSSYYTDAAATAQAAMAARGPPQGAYGKSSALEQAKTDRSFTLAANAETNKFAIRNPNATPEQIDAFYRAQLARLKGQPAAVIDTPPVAPSEPGLLEQSAIGLGRLARDVVTGNLGQMRGASPAEAAGSVQADQAAHEQQLAPPAPPAEKPAAKTRVIEPAGGKEAAPTPIDAPASFNGDPQNEKAVKAWFNGLPMDSYVVVPGSPPGTAPMKKHSNFK